MSSTVPESRFCSCQFAGAVSIGRVIDPPSLTSARSATVQPVDFSDDSATAELFPPASPPPEQPASTTAAAAAVARTAMPLILFRMARIPFRCGSRSSRWTAAAPPSRLLVENPSHIRRLHKGLCEESKHARNECCITSLPLSHPAVRTG
ncbi:hypothetical protein CURTO8I2_220248 [Curtobacterium sp. 8I-2]|nr:hypothetical protein CURTO8I2_220248 [Curtobacterium sp. 8I-2]